jgi:hypothetical protein
MEDRRELIQKISSFLPENLEGTPLITTRGKDHLHIIPHNEHDFAVLSDASRWRNSSGITLKPWIPRQQSLQQYVVLRGLEQSIPAEDVAEALRTRGYKIVEPVPSDVNHQVCKRLLKGVGQGTPSLSMKIELAESDDRDRIIREGLIVLNKRYQVSAYTPPLVPLQCWRCQRFGHTRLRCTSEPACLKCGQNHVGTPCSASSIDFKCKNCTGNHRANDRTCKVYQEALNK